MSKREGKNKSPQTLQGLMKIVARTRFELVSPP